MYQTLFFSTQCKRKNSGLATRDYLNAWCLPMISISFSAAIGSAPSLAYLYERITPIYAANWKEIGILLGIPNGELKIIEASNPTDLKWCCNRMLQKWLEVDSTASLEKLFAAIYSPAVSATHEHNGNHRCIVCKIILLSL